MEIAHFFWHGAPLSIYENVCIKSFCIKGFSVHVWSYDPVILPDGAIARDASEVLPRSDLTRYTQDGQAKNIAAFTDFFRYALLSEHDGWWFDTDVLCLKPASEFSRFKQRLVVGYESDNVINGAVLKINDKSLGRELKRRADSIAEAGDDCFPWGAVGPALITEVCQQPTNTIRPVPSNVFYPIGYWEPDVVFSPQRRDEAAERCRDACCYHIWNEVIRRAALPKVLVPPVGSYLHEVFLSVHPDLAAIPALPSDTSSALFERINKQPVHSFSYHAKYLVPSFIQAVKNRL